MVEFDELELLKATRVKPNHQNLTTDEWKALRHLQGHNDIIIKPADKGSVVVIMKVEDYIGEGHRQLADRNFYRQTVISLMYTTRRFLI